MATVASCVEWRGAKDKRGYGRVRIRGRNYLAHRVALLGTAFSPLCVLHSCDNPSCVNVEHLRFGTHDDNMADMVLRRRAHGGRPKGLYAGEANRGSVKLSEPNVRAIRARRGESQRKLAREFGVIQQTISDIQRGRIWKHIDGADYGNSLDAA